MVVSFQLPHEGVGLLADARIVVLKLANTMAMVATIKTAHFVIFANILKYPLS